MASNRYNYKDKYAKKGYKRREQQDCSTHYDTAQRILIGSMEDRYTNKTKQPAPYAISDFRPSNRGKAETTYVSNGKDRRLNILPQHE